MVGDGGFFFFFSSPVVLRAMSWPSCILLISPPPLLATCSKATEGRERDETGSFQYQHLDVFPSS